MIALQIQDKKKMLQVLLESTSFDTFLMQEVSVIRDSSLFLEGRIHPEYPSHIKIFPRRRKTSVLFRGIISEHFWHPISAKNSRFPLNLYCRHLLPTRRTC